MKSKLSTQPPKFQMVADYLRDQIQTQKLHPGDRVYSLRSLSKKFKVSTIVINQAYQLLEREGLIVSEHGRGTFVKKPAQHAVIGFLSAMSPNRSFGYFDVAMELLDQNDCLFVTMGDGRDKAILEKNIERLRQHKPCAILADLNGNRAVPLEEVKKMVADIPVIALRRWQWAAPPKGPALLEDIGAYYIKGFRFLKERGHNHILLLAFDAWQHCFLDLFLEKAKKKLGKDMPKITWGHLRAWQADPKSIPAFNLKDTPPTALMGHADNLVFQGREILKKARPKLKLGDCLGNRDTEWSSQGPDPFHSATMDYHTFWNQAITLCTQAGGPGKEVIWFEPDLVIRD